MAYIHLVTGEKGGTGKSWFARFLAQYCHDRNFPVSLFDGDTHNPDSFPDEGEIVQFDLYGTGGGQAWHRLLSEVEFKSSITNLPALAVANLPLRSLAESLQSAGISICLWWVTDGSPINVRQLRTAIAASDSLVRWVLVRNEATIRQNEDLDSDAELTSLLSDRHVGEVALPRIFPTSLILQVERQHISMADAVESLGVVEKSQLNRFYERLDLMADLFQFGAAAIWQAQLDKSSSLKPVLSTVDDEAETLAFLDRVFDIPNS